ncbi:MAG: DUF47 family protein, partial [Chloroflexota bacterium]
MFPQMPDFFALLADQCVQVAHTVGSLVEYMETGDAELGRRIKQDEHEADRAKVRNIHTLNESFSTPIDREDIYRAIMDLDDVVNYCKTTVSEMDLLGVTPDKHTLEMAMHLKDGVGALVTGFSRRPPMPTPPAGPNARSSGPIADRWRTCSRATTSSTCSSVARSTATCPTPPTAWRIAPTPCTTSWSRYPDTGRAPAPSQSPPASFPAQACASSSKRTI